MADANVDTPPSGATPVPPAGDITPPITPPSGDTPPPSGDNPPAGDTPPPDKDAQLGNWPADWRKMSAGEDEKILKRLERYTSPKAAIDALLAAQTKLSERGTKLKDNATPEEVKQWRSENGIPEEPTGYDISLPDGLVIGEQEKPLVDGFLKVAHEKNLAPSQVKDVLSWYYQEQDRAIAARNEQDMSVRSESEDALRAEWGQDYRTNVKLVQEFVNQAPDGLPDRLMGARLADGTRLGDDPAALRWLAGLAREINPIASIVGGSGVNSMQAADAELATLRAKMGDRKSDYWKGPNSEKMQARYRDLVAAKERMQKRA